MYVKEKIQPNKVNAPVLFIGVGGIGSKIIKGVAQRCLNDDTDNIRFVVMDTDANDLLSIDKGVNITAVQTSSPSTVEDYLKNDSDAKNKWFPENRMLDSKAVSEGAGQVRAISRLALNATIKQGNINKLYKSIDDLFLKDGGGLKQAIRVVIASTAAGGTGSGIAMETGMLVRHYVKKNYPEAAVMIRGFLVMPGVMDTVIKTQSERDSLRCNGYATIKEINAFMMKGSGFFDTVPELKRYSNLHMVIPGTSEGDEKLDNLPFDFCFLMDRTDSNAGNMTSLPQYINYASQSLYEQNIGPMRGKASSMEDNVLKLCISPEKLGRCRFGGAGASVLRYPYEDVRDYIALNWTRSAIIGSSADDRLTEAERKELLQNSWLQYDVKYEEEYKKWEDNPNRGFDAPTRAETYINAVQGGEDTNEFTAMLYRKFISGKINPEYGTDINSVAQSYVDSISRYIDKKIQSFYGHDVDDTYSKAQRKSDGNFQSRYEAIGELADSLCTDNTVSLAANLAKEIFNSKLPINRDNGAHMLESFLSVKNKAIHPNAARYLLYILNNYLVELDRGDESPESVIEKCRQTITGICEGETDDNGKPVAKSEFDVKGTRFSKETDLEKMCEGCDKGGNVDDISRCKQKLNSYFKEVDKCYKELIKKQICKIGVPAVRRLIEAYEKFYSTFESKVPSIERKKEDIVTKLRFHSGDCVRNLMGEKKYLDKITASVGRPADSGAEASELYAKIFEAVRDNAYISERKSLNPFSYETQKDVFDDIIIEYYKRKVEEDCAIINVKGILQAIKLEYDVKSAIDLDNVNEELRERKMSEISNQGNINKYIKNIIERCNNLASPGIKKKDNDEPREVSAIACNEGIADGDGIRVNDFIPDAIHSDTVSRYELRFFRSVYNIMPTQLSKLSAPTYDDAEDEFSFGSENAYDQESAGDYFRIYQKYMDRIGPDCKKCAIITPHVDIRWNAIVAMPELDLDYQKRLMRKIHKSMLYGFLYDRIHLFSTMGDDNNYQKIYKYLDMENDQFHLVVSNKTKCDVLYEVLDALYNDRLAVSIIRDYVNKIRSKNISAGFKSYKKLDFFTKLDNFKYKRFTSDANLAPLDDRVSLFTVVLLYSNTLPAQNKDMAEIKIMVESIIEMVYSEMHLCTPNEDILIPMVAGVLVDQYNLLLDNYANEDLKSGKFSDRVVYAIQGTLRSFMDKRDLEHYKNKMTDFEDA